MEGGKEGTMCEGENSRQDSCDQGGWVRERHPMDTTKGSVGMKYCKGALPEATTLNLNGCSFKQRLQASS
jgi:hypothetical protein